MTLRRWLFSAVGLSLVLGACDTKDDTTKNTGTPTDSLVRDADLPVEIVYSRYEWGAYAGRLVLRQADGVRRFDATNRDDMPPTAGHYVILAPGREHQQLYCSWNEQPTPTYVVDCGTGVRNAAGIDDVIDVLASSTVSGEVEQRVIIGRDASCYQFEDLADGEICLDDEAGVPLSISLDCPRITCFRIEATGFREFASVMAVSPVELKLNAVAGISQGDGRVDVSDLDLPEQFR